MKRDIYNAIVMSSLEKEISNQVNALVNKAANASKIDEHGNWNFGAEFDKKGRGSAINWDLYGIGNDVHSGELLIVIQIRQYIKRSKNHFGQVRKNYFLIGTNEDNTTFAHPVESRVIHAAIKKDADVVKAVQDWIFGADYAKVIRQGDLCLIEQTGKPRKGAEKKEETQLTLQGSHLLISKELYMDAAGNIFAKTVQLKHLPQTHPDVAGKGGAWYKVIVGKRANFWEFSAPTID